MPFHQRWNGNTQVKYKHLEVVLKYSTCVNVVNYFPPLHDFKHINVQTRQGVLSY